jgi:hypothetical protein
MAQTTEAACLLQSGALYSRRLGLRLGSVELFAGVKPGAVSIYVDDAPIYHFDLEGRWQRAFIDGTHYLKGLDATVRSLDRERESGAMVLRRGTLPYAEAADLDASIRSFALSLIDDLDDGRLEVVPGPSGVKTFATEEFREFLERVVRWDSAAWFSHREKYLGAYGPMPFLPPDAPNPLVLQATLGNRNGRAFGGSRPAEYYKRSPAEFLDHCQSVSKLIGRRIAQHKSVFLGGENALNFPLETVVLWLNSIANCFPIGGPKRPAGDAWDDPPTNLVAVHAFLDDFSATLPDVEGWQALRSAHLARVTLGVESGDPSIRAEFGKSWEDGEFFRTVENLKAAGIGVGLVVLVGLAGASGPEGHVEATTKLLGSLPIGRGDLISLVDVRALRASEGTEKWPTDEGIAEQVAAMKAWSSRLAGSGPKVVAYNPTKGGS